MATLKQKKVVKKILENKGMSVSKAMLEAGYPPTTAKNPQQLTHSKGWQELMKEYLPDDLLAKRHLELLNSTGLDHMTFPLGPDEDEDEQKFDEDGEPIDVDDGKERTKLTDNEIKDLLKSVNCTVRKIVHSEHARHVYFWGADNKARKDALDMAYKLKGQYAPDKTLNVNVEIESNLTPEDIELINLIREHDRNPRTKTVPTPRDLPIRLDTEPQN